MTPTEPPHEAVAEVRQLNRLFLEFLCDRAPVSIERFGLSARAAEFLMTSFFAAGDGFGPVVAMDSMTVTATKAPRRKLLPPALCSWPSRQLCPTKRFLKNTKRN